jgi:hypothetical protein
MNDIPKITLEDSLYVLQLARETALVQNRLAQAKRMMPVVEEFRGLVANATQPQLTSQAPASNSGTMGQADFKKLLQISQSQANPTQPVDATTSVMERNRLIVAMANARMSDVDIARQFSITRGEVQLVLNMQQKNK